MRSGGSKLPWIEVHLVVRDNCALCGEVQRELESYARRKGNIWFEQVDLDRGEVAPDGKPSFITPAVWVNRRLWYLGGFDLGSFDERINRLARNIRR